MQRTHMLYKLCLILMFAVLVPVCAANDTPALNVPPGFAAIRTSPENTMYLRFEGKEVRMSPTLDGLKEAKSIAATNTQDYSGDQYKEYAYTFSGISLPSVPGGPGLGWKETKATFTYYVYQSINRQGESRTGSFCSVKLGLICQDARKNNWGYWFTRGLQLAATDASPLPILQVPTLTRATAKLETKVEAKNIRAGIRVTCGNVQLMDITCNGKSAATQMIILPSGEIPEKVEDGDLTKFGFT